MVLIVAAIALLLLPAQAAYGQSVPFTVVISPPNPTPNEPITLSGTSPSTPVYFAVYPQGQFGQYCLPSPGQSTLCPTYQAIANELTGAYTVTIGGLPAGSWVVNAGNAGGNSFVGSFTVSATSVSASESSNCYWPGYGVNTCTTAQPYQTVASSYTATSFMAKTSASLVSVSTTLGLTGGPFTVLAAIVIGILALLTAYAIMKTKNKL